METSVPTILVHELEGETMQDSILLPISNLPLYLETTAQRFRDIVIYGPKLLR